MTCTHADVAVVQVARQCLSGDVSNHRYNSDTVHIKELRIPETGREKSQQVIYGVRELREFFKYATSLVMVLSLYMFQFTMLFTS